MIDVTVEFAPGTTAREIEALMGSAAKVQETDNVMYAGVEECSGSSPCTPSFRMNGFEHMGAGDLECDKAPPKKKR
ncbi:MAG: hypothetical protein ACREP7_20620 [Lysobacter sp.]